MFILVTENRLKVLYKGTGRKATTNNVKAWWFGPNPRRMRDATRTQIQMFFLWCWLLAVWTPPFTSTGPICLHCVVHRIPRPVWIGPWLGSPRVNDSLQGHWLGWAGESGQKPTKISVVVWSRRPPVGTLNQHHLSLHYQFWLSKSGTKIFQMLSFFSASCARIFLYPKNVFLETWIGI